MQAKYGTFLVLCGVLANLTGCFGTDLAPLPNPLTDATVLPSPAIEWVAHPDIPYIYGRQENQIVEVDVRTFHSTVWDFPGARVTSIGYDGLGSMFVGFEYQSDAPFNSSVLISDSKVITYMEREHFPYTIGDIKPPFRLSDAAPIGTMLPEFYEKPVAGAPRSFSNYYNHQTIAFHGNEPRPLQVVDNDGASVNNPLLANAVQDGVLLNLPDYQVMLLDQSRPNIVTTFDMDNNAFFDRAYEVEFPGSLGAALFGNAWTATPVVSSNGYLIKAQELSGQRLWSELPPAQSAAVVNGDEILVLSENNRIYAFDLSNPQQEWLVGKSETLDINYGQLLYTSAGVFLIADGGTIAEVDFFKPTQ